MESLDVETIEQIKSLVNDAKNKKAPLEKTKKVKKAKETKKEPEPVSVPVPQPQPQLEPEPVIIKPEPKPIKPKRVQSEKQKAAFILLQERRKQQVEKQKLVKKIEASKLLLENDVKLKASKSKKPKSTTVDFNNFSNHDSEDSEDSDDSDEEEPEQKPVKQWGTSTRNKKSVKKPVQVVKTESKYIQPTFF